MTPEPLAARSALVRTLSAVLTVAAVAVAFASPASAKPAKPDTGGNGDTAEVAATVDCDGGTVLVTSTEHPLSNIAIEYADGTTVKIEDPFDQVDANGDPIKVFAWPIDLNLADLDRLVVGVSVKAGNNGERGKKNRGIGEHVPIDASGCLIVDTDGDGIADDHDNCPTVANADQANNLAHLSIPTGDACLYVDFDNNGVNDLDEYTNGCIVVWHDGATEPVILLGQHASYPTLCLTTAPTSDLGPNTAIAFHHGDPRGAQANAEEGANNTAIAINTGTFGALGAYARNGDNNTATAIGSGSISVAQGGDNNTATTIGNLSQSVAIGGDDNTVTATGTSATASVDTGSRNTVTATATRLLTSAEVRRGDDNTVTATNCSALVDFRSSQTLTCD